MALDLSKMSDDDIDAIIASGNNQADAQVAQPDLSKMSDDEIDSIIAQGYQAPQSSPIAAGLQSFGQAASLGYLPQLQAGVSKALDFVMPKSQADRALESQGFSINTNEPSFQQTKEQFIQRGQSLEAQNPMASMAGSVAGSIVGGAGLGGLGVAAKGAGMARRLYTGAKAGALMGLLENPGDTEGLTDPLQISERISNAAKGAAIGGVAQGALEGVGSIAKGLKEMPDAISKFSELKAVKASGAMLKDFRRLMGKDKAEKMGRYLLDNKLVSGGDTFESVARKVSAMKEETGSKLGDIYSKFNEDLMNNFAATAKPTRQFADDMIKTQLDAPKIANDLREEIFKELKGVSGSKAALSRIDDELSVIAENGNNLNIQKVHEIRKNLDNLINFDKVSRDQPLLQKQFIKIRNRLNDKINERLGFFDRTFGTAKASELKKLNQEFSMLADAEKISVDRIARDNANQAFGLSEKIGIGSGLATGAMLGGPVGSIALGAAGAFTSKMLRKFGDSSAAVIGDKVARFLAKKPTGLGSYSQQLIEAARQSPKQYINTIMLLRNDPEFKKQTKDLR